MKKELKITNESAFGECLMMMMRFDGQKVQ